MELSVAYEYWDGAEQVAWFEDRDALVEYQLIWVPGSMKVRPRVCAFPGPELPEGVDPGDLLVAMDEALAAGGYYHETESP